jgi:hypothetical protein
MLKLSAEAVRILQKRITKALRKAKYYPAEVLDLEAAAYEVLRPYAAHSTDERETPSVR